MNWTLWYPITKCKQTKINKYASIPKLTLSHRLGLGVCHQLEVKLGGFRSRLGASCMSSHTEELWYNETVCRGMTIYIYVYNFHIFLMYVLSFFLKLFWSIYESLFYIIQMFFLSFILSFFLSFFHKCFLSIYLFFISLVCFSFLSVFLFYLHKLFLSILFMC